MQRSEVLQTADSLMAPGSANSRGDSSETSLCEYSLSFNLIMKFLFSQQDFYLSIYTITQP